MLDWRFLIPVIWSCVSAALALVLYKTSSGLFEQKSSDEKQVRRIRLVGSIVIAGAIFGALKWATPSEVVSGRPIDSVTVPRKVLLSSRDAVSHARNALDSLTGCASISPPQECRSEMEALRDSINGIEQTLPRSE
jgi:hypothetical protein